MDGAFALSDGRALGYAEWGSRRRTVLGFHGTSSPGLAHVGEDARREPASG